MSEGDSRLLHSISVLTASFLLDLSDFLVTQEQRRFIAHDDVVFVR